MNLNPTASEFACRSCGQKNLPLILSLGQTPLANSLLRKEQLAGPEARYPLDLVFCPNCSLVQITETIAPEILFRDYVYFSSFSDTALESARQISTRLIAERRLGPHSLACEVASNDGYLLKNYVAAGVPVLGIEPAENIAAVAQAQGVHTIAEFFGRDLAGQLASQNTRADVIHGNNVLAHVADTNGFVAGLCRLLKDEGLAVIEVPYVKDMIDQVEFDTIYHEHLCYFSLTALDFLFRRQGLIIVKVERLPIHGGSLRIFAVRQESPEGRKGPEASVRQLLAEEEGWGAKQFGFYGDFATRVGKLKQDLVALLSRLKAEGKRIAVYGASAKGSTLLNYFGLGGDLLDYVADRSTVKQGRYTPGTRLLVRAPEVLAQDRPDYVLLLTWNFAGEILAQQAEYRRLGGKFIIPIPELQIV